MNMEVKEMKMKTEKWLGHRFDYVGEYKQGEDTKQFFRDFRSDIKAQCKYTGMALHSMSVNYFVASGFLRNTGSNRLVYFSISDIRYWNDAWNDRILYRNVRHDKDWTGGMNQVCRLADLIMCAGLASQREWY
jgi:hypothetical protein